MKWVSLLGIFLVLFLVYKTEWGHLKRDMKKERVAFLLIMGFASLLSVLLVFFPDLPGPPQLINKLLQPVSRIFDFKNG